MGYTDEVTYLYKALIYMSSDSFYGYEFVTFSISKVAKVDVGKATNADRLDFIAF